MTAELCPTSGTDTLHKLACQLLPSKLSRTGKRTLKLLFLFLGCSSVGSLIKVNRKLFIVFANLFCVLRLDQYEIANHPLQVLFAGPQNKTFLL